jgi:DNA-binding NarL/FixJ family response regulator
LVTFSENPYSIPQNITVPFRRSRHLTGMGNPRGVKRDSDALEKRRSEAMRMLDEGLNHSETARRLKVARQTVSARRRRYLEPGPTAPDAPGASRCRTPRSAKA